MFLLITIMIGKRAMYTTDVIHLAKMPTHRFIEDFAFKFCKLFLDEHLRTIIR